MLPVDRGPPAAMSARNTCCAELAVCYRMLVYVCTSALVLVVWVAGLA